MQSPPCGIRHSTPGSSGSKPHSPTAEGIPTETGVQIPKSGKLADQFLIPAPRCSATADRTDFTITLDFGRGVACVVGYGSDCMLRQEQGVPPQSKLGSSPNSSSLRCPPYGSTGIPKGGIDLVNRKIGQYINHVVGVPECANVRFYNPNRHTVGCKCAPRDSCTIPSFRLSGTGPKFSS